ncbi:helicase HerA domain-containing protein, partial [Mycoplasmopsis bovis]|uniref:helicase HerA domain-containing protein n=1 Tax=Mycoplasmopsis bovis TaxID=28903 RepID=UPI003D28522A
RKLLNDGNSLLVGKELRESDEALVWNMFKLTQYRTNHNVMILGTPGMGKSTFTKKILTNAVSAGNIAIVIDPQAEYINWSTPTKYGSSNNWFHL